MFDVIVDGDIAHLREEAQRGNFDSMVLLATYIQKGMYTRKDHDRALSIFNYVLARKDEIPFKETYWNAIGQKTHIHSHRGEEEIIDRLALDLVRHMVQAPPDEWDHIKLISAVERLHERMPTGLPEAQK
jgi:hypothetical protein